MATLRQHLVARLTRLYPLESGCARVANSRLVQGLAGAGVSSEWSRVSGGEVLAPLNDYVGRAAFFVGDLDRKISAICRRIVRPGDTVLDVGANLGLVTLLMSRLVGAKGAVHAFEPNPAMQAAVTKMIQRNGLTNVHLHPVALGSVEGELELVIPHGNAGAASLVRHKDKDAHASEHCQVPVHTLSNLCERAGIDSIRMIKIDVEGFEVEVLRGAKDLLERRIPEAILFELNNAKSVPMAQEPVIRVLSEAGYGFFSIPKAMFRTTVRRLDLKTTHEPPGHDILAAPLGPRYEELARRLEAAH